MKFVVAVLTLMALPLMAQNPPASVPDSWKALTFLEGTWDAKAEGPAGATTSGTYTFERELGGHIFARHSTSNAGCKGPATFDCEHGDLLYVYEEAPGQPLQAIYFDNEGHVIHYDVSTPAPTTVVFDSEPSQPGPRFRLVYELNNSIMAGKFEMQMPGQTEWKTYLEWSGAKK